jgi:hypothetical protein
MKAISVCQPWASAFFLSEGQRKPVENRDWYSAHRGPLAIHASNNRDWMSAFNDRRRYPELAELLRPLRGKGLPFGAIIGTVEMIDCMTFEQYRRRFPNCPWAGGSKFCHVYANPVPLHRPQIYRGQLGIFEIPDRVIEDGNRPVIAGKAADAAIAKTKEVGI